MDKGSSSKLEKRKRSSRACTSCHQRKVKCNGQEPCNVCLLRSIDCSYAEAKPRRKKSVPSTTNEGGEDTYSRSDSNSPLTTSDLPPLAPGSGSKSQRKKTQSETKAIASASSTASHTNSFNNNGNSSSNSGNAINFNGNSGASLNSTIGLEMPKGRNAARGGANGQNLDPNSLLSISTAHIPIINALSPGPGSSNQSPNSVNSKQADIVKIIQEGDMEEWSYLTFALAQVKDENGDFHPFLESYFKTVYYKLPLLAKSYFNTYLAIFPLHLLHIVYACTLLSVHGGNQDIAARHYEYAFKCIHNDLEKRDGMTLVSMMHLALYSLLNNDLNACLTHVDVAITTANISGLQNDALISWESAVLVVEENKSPELKLLKTKDFERNIYFHLYVWDYLISAMSNCPPVIGENVDPFRLSLYRSPWTDVVGDEKEKPITSYMCPPIIDDDSSYLHKYLIPLITLARKLLVQLQSEKEQLGIPQYQQPFKANAALLADFHNYSDNLPPEMKYHNSQYVPISVSNNPNDFNGKGKITDCNPSTQSYPTHWKGNVIGFICSVYNISIIQLLYGEVLRDLGEGGNGKSLEIWMGLANTALNFASSFVAHHCTTCNQTPQNCMIWLFFYRRFLLLGGLLYCACSQSSRFQSLYGTFKPEHLQNILRGLGEGGIEWCILTDAIQHPEEALQKFTQTLNS